MLWFWLPALLLIIVVASWIAVAVVRRRGGGTLPREDVGAVYGSNNRDKSPKAPPA